MKIGALETEVERMRGRQEPQVTMLAFVDLEERVPADHPLRTIKVLADADYLVGAAYNLVRMARLMTAETPVPQAVQAA